MNFMPKYVLLITLTVSIHSALFSMSDSKASSSNANTAEFTLSDSNDDICRDLVLTTLGSFSRETQDAVTPTMKFEFSDELKQAFKFALMANLIYKAGNFSKPQSHDAFFKSIESMQLFKDLSIELIIEFAAVVDKYMLDAGILASVCHFIVQKTEGKVLDLSQTVVSPVLIKCLVHYYYLLYKMQPMLQYVQDLRSAVRFSIKELIEHKHIALDQSAEYLIPQKTTNTDGTKTKVYTLDLSNEMIDDIDGIEEFFKLVDPETIVAIDLSNNFLSEISIDRLKKCTNLRIINLQRNLFTISPSATIYGLNPKIQINLIGNHCQSLQSPSSSRKSQHDKK